MKTIQLLLFGLVLLATNAYSQNNCKYSYSWGFSGESFELLDSNNFVYKYNACMQHIIGYGKYVKTKKKIKIYFEKASSVFKIDSIENNNTDSINLSFSIQDMQQKSVSFATISILDSSLKKIKAIYSDKNGVGKLHLKNNNNISFIEISTFGYKKLIVPFKNNNFNYMFDINLNDRNASVPDHWELFTYKIGKQTYNKIELKRNKSKYLKYTINCKN
jgi:hypothetical protein